MKVKIWQTPFGIALLIHLIVLTALGYALRDNLKEEIRNIEVTMSELFAEQPPEPPGGGGSPAKADQNNAQPPAPAVPVMTPVTNNIPFQPQQAADASALALASTGVSSGGTGGGTGGGGDGTGSGTGGSGGGSGSGHGTGHSSARGASVLSSSRPPYPGVARRNGWEGRVVLSVLVSADGSPASVSVASSSGHDSLDDAAVRAVHNWSFNPALNDDGQPVEAWKNVAVRFDLNDAD